MIKTLETLATLEVLRDVLVERGDQAEKWGVGNYANGTGLLIDADIAEDYKQINRMNMFHNGANWRDILLGKVYDALSETDQAALRKELIRAAAVAVRWVECIDRRRI